jgi:sensor histidine kinase YesM
MYIETITQSNMQAGIILILLGSGMLCLLVGILILISRGFSKEMRTLADTSTELGKRAINHDMTSLANSVAEILSTVNQMMKTAAGVGAFLILVGVGLMAAAYWLTSNLA